MADHNPTKYFYDAVAYYKKAKLLQDRNNYGGKIQLSGDPLMDNVSIYDTVLRKHAGFSNVLEDLHGRIKPTRFQKKWRLREWLFLYGVHRMTGSGASFYPQSEGIKRHGYMNSILPHLTNLQTREEMVYAIRHWGPPMFTSLGNQPPPFPKPQGHYKTGGKYYLCEIWPQVVDDIIHHLTGYRKKPSIREATKFITDWNVRHGYKRFSFTMTAFTMDIAEYHPSLIDPNSQCNYGANCLLSLDAMYDSTPRKHSDSWYDAAMEMFCSWLNEAKLAPPVGARPMDVEDVLCDTVRYWLQFVPKHGYGHLVESLLTNKSPIHPDEFQLFIDQRK